MCIDEHSTNAADAVHVIRLARTSVSVRAHEWDYLCSWIKKNLISRQFSYDQYGPELLEIHPFLKPNPPRDHIVCIMVAYFSNALVYLEAC